MRLTVNILSLAGLALSFGLATHAQAQVNPFRSDTRSGLTSEDTRMMQQAARDLASQGDVAPGASSPWHNDNTGAGGSVTVANTFHHKGMLCHKVNYEAKTAHQPTPRNTTVNWCKTSRGWKIL